MYFWNIKKLKKDLKKGLSQQQQFAYLLASTITLSISMIPWNNTEAWEVYFAIVMGVITVLGTMQMYLINRGSKGRDFLPRLVSLGWVVSIRWVVLVLIPLSLLFGIALELFVGVPEEPGILDLSFFSLLYVWFFWMLGQQFKEVAA